MTTPANPPITTLFAGEPYTGKLRNGSPFTVQVREMKPSEMNRYFACVHNVSEFAELVTDQQRGWGDTVAPADLLAIVKRAKEINDPFFVQWLDLQAPEFSRMAAALSRTGPVSIFGGSA